MQHGINRREFLAAGAAAGIGLWATRGMAAETAFKTKLQKAMILGKPDEASLKKLKDAGFDGAETTAANVSPDEAKVSREAAEKLGMKIHSVLRGWMQFNSTDPAALASSIASTETALRAAQGFGADAILLVPCRIGGAGLPMPEAWEFQLEFDEKTGHLSKVVAGDNAKYRAYIDAHNQAIDGSTAAVKKLIPVAEETKVVIALENVWNNLWVKPAHFKQFVASFQNPWVKAYFDIGNHVKYAPPQEWIKALGPLLAKCHVKDFKLNPDGHGGKFVNIRDGSIDWPAVRQALEDVNYNGWTTIEGGDLSLEEHSKRLDLIIAGK
ncbi:MAG: sugar phosphate isomerase/epimerase [Planctomycetota bacterium]|nr:sugar phosphate isomerase/epimerase [Planctomycetota bacterium]